MVPIDLLVLMTVAAGTAAAVFYLRRRDVRGRRLLTASWASFYGLVLVAMMAAHSGEILYHTVVGGQAYDGSPWVYNFRVYSLQLLGAVLIWQGAACLRAVPGLCRGDMQARRGVLRAALIVLAVAAPLIPIHAFFGYLITGISAASLLVFVALPARTYTFAHSAVPQAK